jgi:hypothetical protein
MSTIPAKRFISWIERYAGHIADQKDYLTALDSAEILSNVVYRGEAHPSLKLFD